MRLVKDETSTAGRYVNPARSNADPGTFAVVIGVSAYAHLAGGAAPAAETYGLGQLFVSALTAFDFFEWLSRYDASPAPPAQCWLLVSPTPAELAARSELAVAGASPTFENCRKALREWSAAMQALSPAAAQASRSLFFFSGHGVEIHQNQQVLLPADYLAPVLGGVNDAISTANLVNGVACLPVPHHTFFVDACRNDVTRLRERRLEGSRILDETVSANANSDVIAPVLFASAAGTAAYQYRQTDKRSIYGTALLEGLRGDQGISLDCDGQGCKVWMFQLQRMMKNRVEALVREASQGQAAQTQRVLLGGYVDDLTVTTVPVPRTVALGQPVPTPPGPILAGMGAQPPGRAYEVSDPVAPAWHLKSDDEGPGHRLLGSEQLTELLFRAARVTPLRGGPPMTLADADAVVSSVTRSPDTRAVTVALRLPHADPGWRLELPSGDGGAAWTVVLPGDLEEVTYLLDLQTEYPETGMVRPITRLDGALALEGNHAFLFEAAAAWWAYDVESSGAAANIVDQRSMLDVMLHKVRSPLGATIAAHLLLEVRSHKLPQQWLQNLTDWFERPDPPVLLAELAFRNGDEATWRAALWKVAARGLPHLAANLGRLDVHVAELRRRQDGSALEELYDTLADPLAGALAHLRPGGLFASFYGDANELGPGFLHPFG